MTEDKYIEYLEGWRRRGAERRARCAEAAARARETAGRVARVMALQDDVFDPERSDTDLAVEDIPWQRYHEARPSAWDEAHPFRADLDRAKAVVLKTLVERELRSLADARASIEQLVPELEKAPDVVFVGTIGKLLADVYTAVERILRSIVGQNDRLSTGPDWHRELLHLATLELPGMRPAIVRRETAQLLSKLLGFRRVFQSVCSLDLGRARVLELARLAPGAADAFRADCAAILALLDRLAAEA